MLRLDIEYSDPFYETFKTLSELWATRQFKMGTEKLLLPGAPEFIINNIRQWALRKWDLINYDQLMMNDLVINGNNYVYYDEIYSNFYMDRLINHPTEWLLHPNGFIWISDISKIGEMCGCSVDDFKDGAIELMHDAGYDDYTVDTFDQLFNAKVETENRKQLIKWRNQYATK